MIKAFEKASGKPVPYEIDARRAGDVAVCYSDTGHADAILGWKAVRGLEEMCTDHWRWQQKNPDGYDSTR